MHLRALLVADVSWHNCGRKLPGRVPAKPWLALGQVGIQGHAGSSALLPVQPHNLPLPRPYLHQPLPTPLPPCALCRADHASFYASNGLPFVMGTSGADRPAVRDAVQRAGGYAVLPSPAGEQVGGGGNGSNSGSSSSWDADWKPHTQHPSLQSPMRTTAFFPLRNTRAFRARGFYVASDVVPLRLAALASTATPRLPPSWRC